MSVVYKRGPVEIRGNLTPLIDMAFLLIVFFVLVSRLVDLESVPMELPQPKDAATERIGEEQRVVINVMPGLGGAIAGYRVGSVNYSPDRDGMQAMQHHLAKLYQTNPTVAVNVRADRATNYECVEPVLQAVANAARSAPVPLPTARVNLVVTQEE